MTEEKKSKIEEDISGDLAINEGDLRNEMNAQPSKYFYYGSLWARASRMRRNQRLKLREVEASLCNNFRKEMAEGSPGTRVTEAMLNNFLYNHPTFLEHEQAAIQSEYMEEILAVAKEAFRERHQTLLELYKKAEEERLYGDSYDNMRKEFEAVEEKKIRRTRRNKSEETTE
jgi:hypothetical protein